MGKTIDGWAILVVGLILFAVVPSFRDAVTGVFGGLGGSNAAVAQPTQTNQYSGLPANVCLTSDKVTVTLNSNNKYSANSEITNGSHRVMVSSGGNGFADKGYYAEAGSFDVAPGDRVKVIFGLNSTSSYPVIVEKVAPCAGTLEMTAGLATYDNSPTITTWTEDGAVQSATANAQAMSADSQYDNEIKVKVASKYSLGDPDHKGKGNIMCLQYNRTEYDSVKLDGADSAATPNEISAVSGKTTNCYYFDVLANDPNDSNDGEYVGSIISDTTSTQPTTGSNITITLHDTCVDLDADTLGVIFDVEDEDNNELCAAKATGYIYTS
jgi:hypothetical protein